MKRGAKEYKKILAFLSQDFFGDGVPYELAGEGEAFPTHPFVRGKLLEAVECAFIREFLGGTWGEKKKEEKYSLPFWSPKKGWSETSNASVSHHFHFPGAEDWNYIEPFEEEYGLDDIFYNYFGVHEGPMCFDLAMEGCQNLPLGSGFDILEYFKAGFWRGDAKDSYEERYGDYSYEDEEEEDEDGEEESEEFDYGCDSSVLYGRFYVYHLTVAPLPEEILEEMKKVGFDFAYFNKVAGGLLDIMTCYDACDWPCDEGPATLTEGERSLVRLTALSLFGFAEPCLASFKSVKAGKYLLNRQSFSKEWRGVLDGFFRLLTGLEPEESGAVGGTLNGRYYIEENFFVADGEFFFITQIPRDCIVTPGRRLALAAFCGAFDEAVKAAEKKGKNVPGLTDEEGRAS